MPDFKEIPQSTAGNGGADNAQGTDQKKGSAPTISLPKGGGAIRGIGEKFAANPVTGTGSMSVPIATSPGRSGFGPQLALSYDSGSGNGVYGFGWTLSLPAITRKTDKGLPQYLDTEDSDVFILSGAEDLVPVYRQDRDGSWVVQNRGYQRDLDGFWVRDQAGHLVVHEEEIDGYRVRHYRPRIEGLFAQIERWTLIATPYQVHWRSLSKDNILTLYGKDPSSRIADPEDPSRIFSWLICETRDDKGNAIQYGYKSEDGVGVDLTQAHECNRGDQNDPRRTANRYLKRIQYGNRISLLDDTGSRPLFLSVAQIQNADWMFDVVLDYGEHDTDPPTPNGIKPWFFRDDPFSAYRAGFEVRTTRLCQRVLMFHHFEGEEGIGNDCLVRSTDFAYSHEQDPTSTHNPIYTFLRTFTQTGYKREGDGYQKRSLPPVEFEYTEPTVQDTVEEFDLKSLENLPIGLDGTTYQWIDLHGEGLPGILAEQANAWYYKRNISPISPRPVEFAPLECIAFKPNLALASGAQFMDLAGDGEPDVVVMDGPMPGFYEHDEAEGWQPFRPFTARLNRNLRDPNLKFIDLDGDGHADVLITEDYVFVWHSSLAEEGFGSAQRVAQALDENKGPRVVFADGTQSIYLADMSGDGLTDLVRICNNEVCYWPNLGYCRFGAKVTMSFTDENGRSACFDHCDQFNHKFIRLADIDGSGTTDIVYLHRDGVRLYFNQSGNSWSAPQILHIFPHVDDLVSIVPIDLIGNGTACLIWSSPLPGDAGRSMRYVNLIGAQKPHLLVKTINNLGAETRVQYAPSTKFYLQDKYAGRSWSTRLPFPVHVVEKVTVVDHWRKTSFSSSYSYHHGYFDGVEREFRGFGRVEQLDTESYGEFASSNSLSPYITADKTLYQPPVKTITWYHTGAFLDRERILTQFKHEYFPDRFIEQNPDKKGALESFKEHPMPEPDLEAENLNDEEWREALRACKGMVLRQEIYELDVQKLEQPENPKPVPVKLCTTAYHNCTIRNLQPKALNAHAVFLATESEAITYHYDLDLTLDEMNPDPRIAHTLNLNLDEYGNVLQSVAITYPRIGEFGDASLDQNQLTLIDNVQQERHLAYSETHYTQDIINVDNHRLRLPCEVLTYELSLPSTRNNDSFTLDELRKWDLSDSYKPSTTPAEIIHIAALPYHAIPDRNSYQKRLVEHARILFFAENLVDPLPFGEHGLLGLPYENYKLALTDDLLNAVFTDAVTGKNKLDETVDGASTVRIKFNDSAISGYLSGAELITRFSPLLPAALTGQYWVRSGIAGFAPDTDQHFFLPERYTDPFGNVTTLEYDPLDLFIASSTDALSNTTRVTQFDYRVLAPREMQDINDNLSEVFFDVLGMPTAMAVKGKGDEGDNLSGFTNAVANPAVDELATFFDQAILDEAKASEWLGNATTRYVYYLGEIQKEDGSITWGVHPACACGIVREQHVSHLEPGEQSSIQAAFEYSDGMGSVIVKKIQAEPEAGTTQLRWVAGGKTILNNKGKPVKQYEPYFSDPTVGHRYEEPVEVGVTSVIYYDAVGRTVRTEMPDGSYSRVEFSPWHVRSFDQNDTVKEPGNAWFTSKTAVTATTEEKRAVRLAAEHADTPALTILDSLGRAVIAIAHNRVKNAAAVLKDEKYLTFTKLDAEGKPLWIRDARQNLVIQYIMPPVANNQAADPVSYTPCYDIAGNLLYQHSMDAGDRWMLNDAAGKPMFAWDSRGHAFYTEYDGLHRVTGSFVRGADSLDANRIIQFEKLIYGDTPNNGLNVDLLNPENDQTKQLNLRGKLYQHYDTAGVVINKARNSVSNADEAFDFKGNLLRSTRQLISDYKSTPDWSQTPALEAEIFGSSTSYDALNRPIQLIAPHSDQPGTKLSVTRPGYNEANLLERVDVWLEQDSEPSNLLNPATANLNAVVNIDYNAKGQRVRIEYNEATHPIITEYTYDPNTFRLTRLRSTRPKYIDADKRTLQDMFYTYDPVGNITDIRDAAQQTVFFDNSIIEPSNAYAYDALYRLIHAEGREHAAQNNTQRDAMRYEPTIGVPFPNSPEALQRYSEDYEYDTVGNIMGLIHSGGAVHRWNRRYQYALDSNRLLATRLPSDPSNLPVYTDTASYSAKYNYDTHGNMTSMPHLTLMQWDFKDQLSATSRQAVNAAPLPDKVPETTFYVYDGGGQRVRKVTERQNGKPKDERIYLGSFEVYREYNGNGQTHTLERETLDVMDDKQRVALVETRTSPAGADPAPPKLVRFQLGNHLGSASLELDGQAQVISYEEYHPYGTTAYQSARSQTETPKRYRYTGKERDEETGFSYHGARYYAPWLGRWTACDGAGMVDGNNMYVFTRGNPLKFIDAMGFGSDEPKLTELPKAEQRMQDTPVDARKKADAGAAKARRHANSPKKNPTGIGKPQPGDEMAHMSAARHNKESAIPNDIANDPKNIKAMPASGNQARVTNPDGTFRDTDIHAAHEDILNEIQARNQAGKTPGTLESSVAAQNAMEEAKLKSEYMTREHFDQVKAGGPASLEKGPLVDPKTGKVISKETKALKAGEELGESVLKKSGKGARALAKLGKASRHALAAIPVAGIVLGQASAAHAANTGDYAGAALDEAGFIPVVGDLLDAARGGMALGEALDEGLGISDVAAEHGERYEKAAKFVGLGEDSSRIVGATGAAMSSITHAPLIALKRTVVGWFK